MKYSNSTVNAVPVFEFEPILIGIDIHTHLKIKGIDTFHKYNVKLTLDYIFLFDHLQPYPGVPSPCQFLDSILFNFSCPFAHVLF